MTDQDLMKMPPDNWLEKTELGVHTELMTRQQKVQLVIVVVGLVVGLGLFPLLVWLLR